MSSFYKWTAMACLVMLRCSGSRASEGEGTEDTAQVEVRAVFMNCEPDARENVVPDSDVSRFEREELYKHSVLRDCYQKLALTVKIRSEPDQSSGDEFIPIEHVIEGPDKKRVRLLDPYVLRLRRDPTLQAYKLRRIDTVTGIIMSSSDDKMEEKDKRNPNRQDESVSDDTSEDWGDNRLQRSKRTQMVTAKFTNDSYADHSACTEHDAANERNKRSEHNIVVEDTIDRTKHAPWRSKDRFQSLNPDVDNHVFDEPPNLLNEENNEAPEFKPELIKKHDKRVHLNTEQMRHRKLQRNTKQKKVHKAHLGKDRTESNRDADSPVDKSSNKVEVLDDILGKKTKDGLRDRKSELITKFHRNEKDYAVYEIGEPDLWYYVDVQLYEKMSTPEGKTVWYDLTNGKDASVNSLTPEWRGQDMSVRYRAAEWLPRDQYSLPGTSLCLLVPESDGTTYNQLGNATFSDGDYLVVPSEDIMALQENGELRKRSNNYSELNDIPIDLENQNNRRVVVRTSRALLKSGTERLSVACRGSDRYLTIPHRRTHRGQIDLEARADGNELVRVGASGRISTAVADSTQTTRTVISIQAANTGLAAARFRVVATDCGPELAGLMSLEDKALAMVGPLLLPPRHTRDLKLELPITLPVDVAHCSVALVNEGDESVAVRDVTIKKGDRCFCVWHCECVCLSDDPKLLCREMAEGRQAAAGLSIRDRVRHGRSICYADDVYVNLTFVFFGVILVLLLLGLIKACLGLVFRCIATFGLSSLLKAPRHLDCYYERSLASRQVVYNDEGWPVHPDTRKKTVHVVSWPMEFFLNLIFFVAVPCVSVYEAIRKCRDQCKNKNILNRKSFPSKDEKCFSSQDLQGIRGRMRRRRGELRKWMSPDAQQLSTDIVHKGLAPQLPPDCEFMKPLLVDDRQTKGEHDNTQDSGPDSEQEDTEYVLKQMQKSRESLARNERKLTDPDNLPSFKK